MSSVNVYSIINVTLLMIVVSLPLDVSSYALPPSYHFRHLFYRRLQTNASPSPKPSHSGLNFHCNTASRTCQVNNLTACLSTYSQSGEHYSSRVGPHEEMGLYVQNNGENPLHVKVTILPAKDTIEELDLPSHQMQKISISSEVDVSSAIALESSNGDCVIDAAAAAPAPDNHYQKNSFSGTYITPINGAYLGIVLILIGGGLTCYKKRIRGRHLDGIAYHELEMGDSTAMNVETNQKENWDQDWDDEWGDEKPTKADGDNLIVVEQVNGLATRSPKPNGKRKEWND
uniref:uncharacterized protein LOC122603905 isoform X2 n=1 Tax=Erigeron canadensis TaxID=72917 RepID=UPI001CB97F8E|nr:uncharacterized protein LOC122603905 isoform X2 [Erigeron canadensis]